MVHTCVDIAAQLDATLVNMRFVKPLDMKLIESLSDAYDLIVTVEENAIAGGAGSGVNEALATLGMNCSVLNIGIPDRFVEHGSREDCLVAAGLDADGVLAQIMRRLQSIGLAGTATPKFVQENA